MKKANPIHAILAVSLVVVLTVAPGLPAGAHDTTQRMPDGTPAYLYRNYLTTAWSDTVEWVRQNNWNPTDLTTLYASYVSSTYVNIVDNDYGATGWVGAETCGTGPNNSGVCQRSDVMINQYPAYIPGGSWSLTERRSLMCEEMGHSLGMNHNSYNGCMSQDWADSFYSSHDIGHINSWY